MADDIYVPSNVVFEAMDAGSSYDDWDAYQAIQAPELKVLKGDDSDIMDDDHWEDEAGRFPWNRIVWDPEMFSSRYSRSSMIRMDLDDPHPSILGRMASAMAKAYQFPPNTAFLHGLGAFSSACVVNFEVQFYDDSWLPVCLYTLGAQPSGSAKSSVNKGFINPVHEAFAKRNRVLSVKHARYKKQIDELNKKLEKATDLQVTAIVNEIADREYDLLKIPMVGDAIKNPTPEGGEVTLKKQGGIINIVSDEAEAVNSWLGLAYGDQKGKKQNNGIFLAASDNGSINTVRVMREGYSGNARGAFAVIAQGTVIDSVMESSASGRGIAERLMIIREPSLLGRRKIRQIARVDHDLVAEYQGLCHEVVQGEYPIRLRLGPSAMELILDMRDVMEPELACGAKYGDERVRGAAAKIDKRVIQMAAVFHIADYWLPGKKKIMDIEDRNILKAMKICMDNLNSFVSVTNAYSSETGGKAAMVMSGKLAGYAKKGGTHITVRKIRDNVKNVTIFKEAENQMDFIINLLRRCELMNFCVIRECSKNKSKWVVLLNPELKSYIPPEDEA